MLKLLRALLFAAAPYIVTPDQPTTWTPTPDLPAIYWLDPDVNYLRTEGGSILVNENGAPFVPQ